LAKIPLDKSLDKMAKIEYLRGLLEKRLEEKDKAADPKGWFRLKFSISSFYTFTGDFKTAETILRELIPDDEDDRNASGSWQSLAVITYLQHHFEEAEKYGIKALNAIQKLLGDDSPQSLGTLRLLTRIAALQGKYDEAGNYLDDVGRGVSKLKDGNKYEKYEPEERKAYEKTIESVENIKKGVPGAGYEDWDGGLPKEDDWEN
jgi:tetratricopeptide (TPR) repeat protein